MNKTIEMLLSTRYLAPEAIEYIYVFRKKEKIDILKVANNIYSFSKAALIIFKVKNEKEEKILISDLNIFSEKEKIIITGNEINKEEVSESLKNKKELKVRKLEKSNDSFFGKTEWNISAIENKKIIEFAKIKNLIKMLGDDNASN